jgi:hypothetical protein
MVAVSAWIAHRRPGRKRQKSVRDQTEKVTHRVSTLDEIIKAQANCACVC